MNLLSTVHFAAKEILARNERLPCVMVEVVGLSQNKVLCLARTIGCVTAFKIDPAKTPEDDGEEFWEQFQYAAQDLASDERFSIPVLTMGKETAVLVTLDRKLRPNAAPIHNGHDKNCWHTRPEGYRH
jgi:hypothetical protein